VETDERAFIRRTDQRCRLGMLIRGHRKIEVQTIGWCTNRVREAKPPQRLRLALDPAQWHGQSPISWRAKANGKRRLERRDEAVAHLS
jgi:hypothetical protein